MTWQKNFIIIFLFFLFALLQKSFLSHYSIFGYFPNLVFILFFLLSFFPAKEWENFLYAVTAGFLVDIFSYTYLGPSIFAFLIIGFLLKKIQSSLKNRQDSYPFVYFCPLFLVGFIFYEFVMTVYFRFFDSLHVIAIFDFKFVVAVLYNLVFATLFFYLFKKCRNLITD